MFDTTNAMHPMSDIENNLLEGLKCKLKVLDKRLEELEEKFAMKFDMNCGNRFSVFIRFLEGVALWTLVIIIAVKVLR